MQHEYPYLQYPDSLPCIMLDKLKHVVPVYKAQHKSSALTCTQRSGEGVSCQQALRYTRTAPPPPGPPCTVDKHHIAITCTESLDGHGARRDDDFLGIDGIPSPNPLHAAGRRSSVHQRLLRQNALLPNLPTLILGPFVQNRGSRNKCADLECMVLRGYGTRGCDSSHALFTMNSSMRVLPQLQPRRRQHACKPPRQERAPVTGTNACVRACPNGMEGSKDSPT